MAKRKSKKQKDERQERFDESSKPERLEETQLEPQPMGGINVPDRSGVSSIRDRGR